MSTMKNKAGLIGIKNAVIGSLLFAIVEGISFRLNEHVTTAESIHFRLLWIAFIFCISSSLSIIPGYLGGKIIERLSQKSKWSRISLMVLGAALGSIAVILISLSDLFLELSAHNYWSLNNNPAFLIYITRLAEVVIIASLMGSRSGLLITRYTDFTQSNTGSP